MTLNMTLVATLLITMLLNDALKILNLNYMPQRQLGLSSWGVVQLDELLNHYGEGK